MAGRPIIRIGDKTSHGGTVTQGFPLYTIEGRSAAGLGHMVACPQCKGVFPIVEGVLSFTVDGSLVAIEGMKTSCGATLIASQDVAVLDPGPGGVASAAGETTMPANGLVGTAAGPGQPLWNAPGSADCDHADTAVPLAGYMVREMKTNPFSKEGRKIAAANSADPQAQLGEWQQLPWYARMGGQPDFHAAAAGQKAAAYAMWAERVGPGRPWDHKPVLRKILIAEGTFNEGWQKYGKYDYFFDIWSNIHYGYVGIALGFHTAELINGAGLAQALDDGYRALKKMKVPTMQNHAGNGPWPASADDVPDHVSIKLGCDLYQVAKPHELTVDLLLQRISAIPLPWGLGENKAKRPHDCQP